ncbi:unnamed protein product [Symbiodinium natans]|uniref:Uncharacterized protein n=1 Tax=Symbiodinium natans TaxID=878477 RepID=A0A812RJD9_9DINO|nr:unnamed protein product [Symbiodinium natans]CAE7440435.1 unnamed protein product [Symbiodinium natans]
MSVEDVAQANDQVQALMQDFLTFQISEDQIHEAILTINKGVLKALGLRWEAVITEDCISIQQVSLEALEEKAHHSAFDSAKRWAFFNKAAQADWWAWGRFA